LKLENGGLSPAQKAQGQQSKDPNFFMYAVVICTLALVMVAVIGVLLTGLFDTLVDNTKIFEILGPAFQTIVGAFVGIIGGRQMSIKPEDDK
jgi:uncharacterized membrane protein YraQ (UPF0718 family)